MERMLIFVILLLVGTEGVHAQVNPPQVNLGPGTAVTAAPATSSNSTNLGGVRFCSTSSAFLFILGAPNCGSDPLSVPTSVISSAGIATGAATSSTGSPGTSSGSSNSASQAGASTALCSLTVPSTGGTLTAGGLFGGC